MSAEFPALVEKIARLENSLNVMAGQLAEASEVAAAHARPWQLTLERDGRVVGSWQVPSDGGFEWEGDGVRIELR